MLLPNVFDLPSRWDDGLPHAVLAVIGDSQASLVWVNELGGLTFELTGPTGSGRRFLKWSPADGGADLARERARLSWIAGRIPVPRVLESGADDQGSWLLTAALEGETAVTERWRADPARAIRAIGEGLRRLHDTLPVADCPFSWSAADRVADARARVAAGSFDTDRWRRHHGEWDLTESLVRAADPPPVDRLVVCHGDACSPNTLVGADGRYAATVDLGDLGVADRWADLAVATLSTRWNYGPGWESALLAAYGVEPDPVRTDYYRLLWALDP